MMSMAERNKKLMAKGLRKELTADELAEDAK